MAYHSKLSPGQIHSREGMTRKGSACTILPNTLEHARYRLLKLIDESIFMCILSQFHSLKFLIGEFLIGEFLNFIILIYSNMSTTFNSLSSVKEILETDFTTLNSNSFKPVSKATVVEVALALFKKCSHEMTRQSTPDKSDITSIITDFQTTLTGEIKKINENLTEQMTLWRTECAEQHKVCNNIGNDISNINDNTTTNTPISDINDNTTTKTSFKDSFDDFKLHISNQLQDVKDASNDVKADVSALKTLQETNSAWHTPIANNEDKDGTESTPGTSKSAGTNNNLFNQESKLNSIMTNLQHSHTMLGTINSGVSDVLTKVSEQGVTLSKIESSGQNPLTETSLAKINSNIRTEMASYSTQLQKNVIMPLTKAHGQSSGFSIANSKGQGIKYDALKTVIIAGHSDNKLNNSRAMKQEISKSFRSINIDAAYPTSKGTLVFQFKSKEEADQVISNWDSGFFGGGTSAHKPLQEKKYGAIKDVPLELDDDAVKELVGKRYGVESCKRIIYRDGKKSHIVQCKFASETDLLKAIDEGIIYDEYLRLRCEASQSRQVRVIRCYNCQQFGHISKFCQKPQTCKKCSGQHNHDQCNTEKAQCANCGMNHCADSVECRTFIDYKSKLQLRLSNRNHYD